MYTYYKILPFELSTLLIALIYGYFYIIYFKYDKEKLYKLLNSSIFLLFISSFLKIVFWIPRPFSTDFLSFPSNHTAITFSLYYIERSRKYLLFPLIIGVLRILEGYHTILDIFGTFIIFFVLSTIWNDITKNLNTYSIKFSLLFVANQFLITNDTLKAILVLMVPLIYSFTSYFYNKQIDTTHLDTLISGFLVVLMYQFYNTIAIPLLYLYIFGILLIDKLGNLTIYSINRIFSTIVSVMLIYIHFQCLLCVLFSLLSLFISYKISKKFAVPISTILLISLFLVLQFIDINLLKLY